MIHYIDFTTSTNDEARGVEYGHMDVVWAGRQSVAIRGIVVRGTI